MCNQCMDVWRKLLDGTISSITFTKGFKEYEKWYEDLKDDELFKKHFERVEEKDFGYTKVIIRRKNEKD